MQKPSHSTHVTNGHRFTISRKSGTGPLKHRLYVNLCLDGWNNIVKRPARRLPNHRNLTIPVGIFAHKSQAIAAADQLSVLLTSDILHFTSDPKRAIRGLVKRTLDAGSYGPVVSRRSDY